MFRLAQLLLKIQSSIIAADEPRPSGINIPAPQVSDLINLHDAQVFLKSDIIKLTQLRFER
jgi:hypothetical protein